MSKKRILQILAGYTDGDAISSEARMIKNKLNDMGYECHLFAPETSINSSVASECNTLDKFNSKENDIVLFHYSICSEANNLYKDIKCKKYFRYHNITPAEFFRAYDDNVFNQLTESRLELPALLKASDSINSVSRYNATELNDLGYKDVRVYNLFFESAIVPPDENIISKFDDDFINILFVGRIVPNKNIEELIMAFNWYNKTINKKSRLLLVGSEMSCQKYFLYLKMLCGELDLQNVCFEGYVSDSARTAYYKASSLFVVASEHEGYCLPLLEAMENDIPVISKNTGGTPEAMGNAGVLYKDLDEKLIGELFNEVLTNQQLLSNVLQSQWQRIKEVRERDINNEIIEMLNLDIK